MVPSPEIRTEDVPASGSVVGCRRGPLVSVEGITGVGKTHLTTLLQAAALETGDVVLDGFSQRQRSVTTDLGRDLLRTLISAADGDGFLRGGCPASETMLLLSIKMFDYENCLPALRRGRAVLEGRSLLTVAVYQSLIMHGDDGAALTEARAILATARTWRPLPDLTILLTDDLGVAAQRAQQRDGRPYSTEQWDMQRRAATLYEQLAGDDPDRVRVLDRRAVDSHQAVDLMRTWIAERRANPPCLPEPWRASTTGAVTCPRGCRLAEPVRR
jgi:dTMP kinase